MFRGLYLGFIRLHILHHATREPVYGLAMMHELRRHGYDLSPGTLYPMLQALERAGYLDRTARLVGGKVRKYYTATAAGETALTEARGKIAELAGEVVANRTPLLLTPEELGRMEREES